MLCDMQAIVDARGSSIAHAYTWLYWPVIVAAYKARQVEVMWQEVDRAFHTFAIIPRRAAVLLGELLQHIRPVSPMPAGCI